MRVASSKPRHGARVCSSRAGRRARALRAPGRRARRLHPLEALRVVALLGAAEARAVALGAARREDDVDGRPPPGGSGRRRSQRARRPRSSEADLPARASPSRRGSGSPSRRAACRAPSSPRRGARTRARSRRRRRRRRASVRPPPSARAPARGSVERPRRLRLRGGARRPPPLRLQLERGARERLVGLGRAVAEDDVELARVVGLVRLRDLAERVDRHAQRVVAVRRGRSRRCTGSRGATS